MAELHVSKKTIAKLFSEMQGRLFIIPDYQRPYKWNVEKCETLWNDIENFAQTDARSGNDYFLGTIVSHVNNEKNQEVIDGQQRITSLMLLLRAFYRKLEDMSPDDEDVIGLMNQLAPCIWDINPISQKISDKKKIRIQSLVATESDNATFHTILETGRAGESLDDHYSKNYLFFKKRCDQYASDHPMQWKQLCVSILQKCIILPIECDTQDTALTIFSTLNDRGLPLADSDIFKAQIYRNLDNEQKRKDFTDVWKDLTEVCKQAQLSIDDIFRYYTHVLRGRNDDKTKEIGLRKFYAHEQYKRLKDKMLMPEIIELANFWRYVNIEVLPDGDTTYTITKEARKYLHCLNCYPNEFWKYATSVYFLTNCKSSEFDNNFPVFLKKLVAFMFAKFIEAPTVNAIKDDIYAACAALAGGNSFNATFVPGDQLRNNIDNHASSRMSRALLLLEAYQHPAQADVIPPTFDVEHIFPKKWQQANYNGWDQKDASAFLDRFGNKIVFEKKLNIQAGNGYFGQKKNRYSASSIASVIELSNYHKNDWIKDDIEAREIKFKDNLLNFFNSQLSVN